MFRQNRPSFGSRLLLKIIGRILSLLVIIGIILYFTGEKGFKISNFEKGFEQVSGIWNNHAKGKNTLTYKVNTDGPQSTIEYGNASMSPKDLSSNAVKDAGSDWSRETSYDHNDTIPSQVIIATLKGNGKIRCQIIVNGKVVSDKTSQGNNAVAKCVSK